MLVTRNGLTIMFENFTNRKINIGDCTIDLVMAGDGPAYCCCMVYPETKVAWRKIAPHLTKYIARQLTDDIFFTGKK